MLRICQLFRVLPTLRSCPRTTFKATMTTAAGHPVTQSQTNGIHNGTDHKQFNAWQQPGPAAYDFRSDTITTPTASMLNAIINTTLLDDVYLEDTTTNAFEAMIAQLANHEAALLVMSGTMGNQISIRSHLTSPPHSVVCDYRSHIMTAEAGGISTLSGAMLIPVRPKNNHHMTLEDVKAHTIISDNVHCCPTRVISLENTLGGMIMPLDEVKRISQFARDNNIKLHLDGARIWEVAASGAGSLPDFTSCFDSASLCFSKGLGAPIGSIIVGSKEFITQARRFRKMFGGGTRQAGILAAPAKVAVEETFGRGPNGEGGKLRACHKRAQELAALWEKKGGKLANPAETNMVWLDLEAAGVSADEFIDIATEEGIKTSGGRLVIHYQIVDDAILRLEKTMDRVIEKSKK